MRKFFKIFLIIFDQKSQNHVIWFIKEHTGIKICGHLVKKLKKPFCRVFFVDLKQILKKKFERKTRQFFIMFGTFIQNFSNSKKLIRTQNFLKKP